MILENSKGQTLDVEVALLIKNKTKKYYVYSCDKNFYHVGLKKNKMLVPLTDKEYELISQIVKKIMN